MRGNYNASVGVTACERLLAFSCRFSTHLIGTSIDEIFSSLFVFVFYNHVIRIEVLSPTHIHH